MSPNPEPVKILKFYSKDFFRDFKVDDLPVYIIRIEIKIHRNQHSGTDNPVFIEIGKSTSKYFLNKGGNDFESDTKNFFQ